MDKKVKPFKFKQFDVYQDKCAMKVGTDGVLLGAWADTTNADSILDIGTGTGLISLMLAQRSAANITALELDRQAALQATSNFKTSAWSERLELINSSLQEYESNDSFDLIVSNPPYFKSNKALSSREKARNQSSLPLNYLIERVSQQLNTDGVCCLVLPIESLLELKVLCKRYKLHINKLMKVKGNSKSSIKRILLEISFKDTSIKESTLVIEPTQRHNYSEAYERLLKDYLLIF